MTTQRRRVVLVVGTRPEAIKMAPIHRVLARSDGLEPLLLSAGQHRELLADALSSLELTADHDLALMQPDQSPNDVCRRIFETMPEMLERLAPAAVVVQGDTTTAFATGLVAHHLKIPLAHVEAGFRTYDLESPFPEEANRQLVDRIADWCFASTREAADNLRAERIEESRIHCVGSTAVDSVLWALERIPREPLRASVLLTLHRRESFGSHLEEILLGVSDFLHRRTEATVLWPVHPNPRIDVAADSAFAEHPRAHRVAPLPYVDFVAAMLGSKVVLSDSGGIQEEAPSLGKTLLVARERTERNEATPALQTRLVGRSRAGIAEALAQAWEAPEYAGPFPAPNPYGDGSAGARITRILERALAPLRGER